MKRINEVIKIIKEMSKDKKGKSILFFGGYFIFFLILILVLRFSDNVPRLEQKDYINGKNYAFNLDNVKNGNYLFDYSINLDNVSYNYKGKKHNDDELFTFNNKEYYKNTNGFLVNNSLWVKSNNPYIFSEIIDIDKLSDIIDNATYNSKTVFENSDISINFLVSTNTINNILYKTNTDFDEVPNEIAIYTDKLGNVYEIKIKLDSFCVNNKKCRSSLNMDLKYSGFDEIYEIESPV